MNSISNKTDTEPRQRPLARLAAWWNGASREPSDPPPERAPAIPIPIVTETEPPTVASWPEPRIATVQSIFGAGFTSAGGERSARALFGDAGMNSSNHVIELGAGLGGMTRQIAAETGAAVLGFEADDGLGQAGAVLSKAVEDRELRTKASIEISPLETFEAKLGDAELVVAKEALYPIENKLGILKLVNRALQPGGKAIFTDYFAAESEGGNEGRSDDGDDRDALAAWSDLEQRPLHLCTADQFELAASKAGLSLSGKEEITTQHVQDICADFGAYARIVEGGSMVDELGPWFLAEAEYWVERVRAIESQLVKVYMFSLYKL